MITKLLARHWNQGIRRSMIIVGNVLRIGVLHLLSVGLLFATKADAPPNPFPKLDLRPTDEGLIALALTPNDQAGTNFTVETTEALDPTPYWAPVTVRTLVPTNSAGFYRVRFSDQTLSGQDSDGDGIDDLYELRHPQFLDPNNPSDSSQDWDGDGRSNLAEYLAGSDPDDPEGRLVSYLVPGTNTGYAQYSAGIKTDGRLVNWQVPFGAKSSAAVRLEDFPNTQWRYIASSGETHTGQVWTTNEVHTLAIAKDGSLWGWGSNASGELGIGSGTNSSQPVQVGKDRDWMQAVAGVTGFLTGPALPQFMGLVHFSAAIKTDGTLWQWGLLTTNDISTNGIPLWTAPRQVGTDSTWTSIQLFRGGSIVGLKRDGSLWIWGNEASWSLGTNTSRLEQIAEPREFGGTRDWMRILPAHSQESGRILAIKRDGTLWTWNQGVIGQPESPDLSQPAAEIGGGWRWRTAEYIQGGDNTIHVDAIREDGTLWAWGYIIGLARDHILSQPLLVDATHKWRSLHAGVARRMDGSLWRVGGGSLADRPVLSQPWQIGLDHDWAQVSAGLGGSAGLRKDGSLWHWGRLHIVAPAQLQTNFDSLLPVGIQSNWRQISLGRSVTDAAGMFGVLANGSAELWGYPLLYWGGAVVNLGTIGGGNEHGGGGFVFVSGQSPAPSWQPAPYGTNGNWQTILRGRDHGVGLKSDGSLWSWGLFPRPLRNTQNQEDIIWLALSNNVASRVAANTPTRLPGRSDWVTIATGADHDAAITADGSLYTFGYNDDGQLGIGGQQMATVPVPVGIPGEWTAVAAGDRHTLGIKKDGSLWAWGSNDQGQLGIPDAPTRALTPLPVGTPTQWKAVYAGPACSFALDNEGKLWAWGANSYGQLGVGDRENHSAPTPVPAHFMWNGLSAGDSHTLAIATDGSLWGWGDCFYGAVPDESIVPLVLYSLDDQTGW